MSARVHKNEYIFRKLLKVNNNVTNTIIEISDEEAIELGFFNYYVGLTNPSKSSWSTSDFNMYSSSPVTSLVAPSTTDENKFTVFIYPESWGDFANAIVVTEGETRNPYLTQTGNLPWNPTLPTGYKAAYIVNANSDIICESITWNS